MTNSTRRGSPRELSFSTPPWLPRFNSVIRDLADSPRTLVPLHVDSLLHAASQSTQLSDFGSPDFREPLDVLVESLEEEAILSPMGRLLVRGDLLNLLENRLRLVATRQNHPEIREESIAKPIFIVGLPRSGTSILHELLARDSRLRAPLSWEIHSPCPSPSAAPSEEQERTHRSENIFTFWNELIPEYRTMHEMGARIPCECIWLTAHSFRSEEFLGRNQVPSYGDWLATADLGPAYALHREILQLLAWQNPTPRWLLKAPSHMVALQWLFSEYPDARIIQTHRDPLQIMGSSVNLLKALWSMRSEHVDPQLIQASFAGEGLAARLFAALDYRDSRSSIQDQFQDVVFSDLMQDPISTIASLYDWLELELTAEVERAMREYLAENPRGKHGQHEYQFADLGLDLTTERERFLDYQERFGVPVEVR